MACLECSVTDGVALRTEIACKLYNQDTILGRKGYEQNNTDLSLNADRCSHGITPQHGTEQSYRKPHNRCNRASPAFVLGCKYQEGNEQCHDEYYSRGSTCLRFLIGYGCPFIAEFIPKLSFYQAFHLFDSFAGTAAWRHVAGDGCRGIHVIPVNLVHTQLLVDMGDVRNWNDLPRIIRHTQIEYLIYDPLGIFTFSYFYLVDMTELYVIVNVCFSHVIPQGCKYTV